MLEIMELVYDHWIISSWFIILIGFSIAVSIAESKRR